MTTRQSSHSPAPSLLGARISRRALLTGLGAAGLMLAAAPLVAPAGAQEVDTEMVLNDPDSPVGGNPAGSLTIVAFFDYNCPFCRSASSPLEEVVRADGDIRLVYKEWPILAESSVDGAVLALAARRQGKYETAHAALMAQKGRPDAASMRRALAATDIDMARLEADILAHRSEIDAMLARNLAIAEALGLQGTPVYLVGPLLVAAALDKAEFEQVIVEARARELEAR